MRGHQEVIMAHQCTRGGRRFEKTRGDYEAIMGQSQRDAAHRLQNEHAPQLLDDEQSRCNQGAIKACAPAA